MRDRRTVLIVLLSFLSAFLGASMAILVTGTLRNPSVPSVPPVAQRSAVPWSSGPSSVPAPTAPALSVPVPETTPPTSRAAPDAPTASLRYEAAVQKMIAGRLEDAQGDFLQILLTSHPPVDPRVMQGLVRVRRQMAHDDPTVLRRQAAAYRQAIAQGTKTGEGYTPAAMDLLAEASLRAANELAPAQSDTRQGRSSEPTAAAPPLLRPVQEPTAVPLKPGSSAVLGKAEPGVPPASLITYTVRSGDSLFLIAKRFGVTVRALTEHNRLTSQQLQVGQQLRIPAPNPPQRAAPPPASAPPPPQAVAASPAPTPPPPQAVATPPAPAAPPPQAVATPPPPTPPVPAPVAPTPVPAPALVPLPPLSATGSFYTVQIGPIGDPDRASEIAGELTLGGFVPRTSRREEPVRYRVVTDPLLREIAERRATALAQQDFRPGVRLLAGGLAQLDFGVFPSQEGAAALAKRVRTIGYSANVAREGGSFYAITLGPHQRPAVDAIAKIIARFTVGIIVTAVP